ncbi:MAG: helix-turn-helix transcriptional regulator [Bacteroidota bacterium]
MEIASPPRFLNHVDEIISENIDNENFNVEILSQALFLSPSQVYRKIKAQTGLTPSSYIRVFRLNCAKELIENSEFNISRIADMVGFNFLSYFSTAFANEFGYPPSHLK